MKFALAKKVNMTQVFGEDGMASAVTVLDVSPLTVTQVKTIEKDGYNAIQIGAGIRRDKNISKAVRGHIAGTSLPEKKAYAVIKEVKGMEDTFTKGDTIGLEAFAVGDKVVVSGISKGKGFQGVVKRHGFHGGPRSHGQKHSEREPGSIGGAGRDGGRVAKGKRMAGRMGSDRVTIKGLKILGIDIDSNTMLVSGAIPGKRGTLIEIRSMK